jgi:phospholipase/carboxylesterase
MVGRKDTPQVSGNMTDLPSLIHAPPRGGPVRQLVVLLHGLGAGGADLIDLAPVLARSLPDALFVAPDAPFPCDLAPFGRQWFSLQSRLPADMAAGVRQAGPVLAAYLAEQLERASLGPDALALLGFSQGAMMALHVGLRLVPPPAAIVAISGRLVEVTALHDEPSATPPVLLVHGDMDDVVPVEAMSAAEVALRDKGVPVECCLRPGLGHAIDAEGLDQAAAFLARHFGI